MNRTMKLLMPLGLLAGLTGISIGATFALFSSTKTINNHIKAGKLGVDFYLNELVHDSLNGDGFAEESQIDLSTWTGYEAGKGVNLKVYGEEVISIEGFCPDMDGHATFTIYNTGAIAFNYTLAVINKSATYAN